MKTCPKYMEIKWHSLADALHYIEANKAVIDQVIDEEHPEEKEGNRVKLTKHFTQLIYMISEMIERLEGDKKTLVDAYLEFRAFINVCKRCPSDSPKAIAAEVLEERLQNTGMRDRLDITFAFTKEGRASVLGITRPPERSAEVARLRDIFMDLAKELGIEPDDELHRFFGLWFKDDKSIPFRDSGNPLDPADTATRAMSHWRELAYNQKVSPGLRKLAQIAYKLVATPASEAMIERIFSLLWAIHTSQRKSLAPDLIEAILRIKLWVRYRGNMFPSEFPVI